MLNFHGRDGLRSFWDPEMQADGTKSVEDSLREAEDVLTKWGIKFTKMPDDFLQVADLHIAHMGLSELPDFSRVKVLGGFNCENNYLRSLRGSPAMVGGTFNCCRNRLTSLEGAPVHKGQLFFSDFGSFNPSHPIPESLLITEETIVRQATVLQSRTTVHRPLRLKTRMCP
jgi:hypothetical protein